jgi:ribonuclease P protein component
VSAQGFSKSERLLKRSDFLRLSGQGRKSHVQHFLILCAETSSTSVRVGITVSRKVGCAVVRNRIKRLVREFYRLNKGLFAAADYNIIAKPGAGQLEFAELARELSRALQRLGY